MRIRNNLGTGANPPIRDLHNPSDLLQGHLWSADTSLQTLRHEHRHGDNFVQARVGGFRNAGCDLRNSVRRIA